MNSRASILALTLVLVAGCGAQPQSTCDSGACVSTDAQGLDASDAATSMDASSSDRVDLADNAATDVRAGRDVADAGNQCSADLRAVVDPDGRVVQTCPPDQGCAAGVCVDACMAAAQSHGNVGCDFLVPTPPSYPPDLPPCFAVFVANTWPHPARVTVTRGGTSYDVTQFGRMPVAGMPESAWPPVPSTGVPADQVAVLFLSSDPGSTMLETGESLACPIAPAVNASTVVSGSDLGAAFEISSDIPVSAYDILPYGGARSYFPSAELLLPSSAWGESYVVADAPPGTSSPPGPMYLQVLALRDGTSVRIRPTVDLPGTAVPTAPSGVTTTVSLSAGQYVQWELPQTATADPSGTLVSADMAVAVFAGNRFLRLQPMPEPGGESTHQQMPPAEALGWEYAVAPYETRRADLAPEVIPYRLVGVFDGTTLSFDPPLPVSAGAPTTLARGEVVDFQTDLPFRVSSQDAAHPFSLAQLMTTANVPGGSRPGATDTHFALMLGDEEHVLLIPPAQFLSHYVFFTDPTYATTNLAIVRGALGGLFHPVTVDCLGAIPETAWRPVGTDGRFEYTTTDLVRAGVGVNGCTNGRHVADSDAPFGVMVWGEDTYASYAYPAGGNASALTQFGPLVPQ